VIRKERERFGPAGLLEVCLTVGAFNSDDTVTLKAPGTWMRRVTDRIDSAVSGAFARVRRPAAQNPPAPTGVRKR
jgi:hypothetical protein